MEFRFTEDQNELRTQARRFLAAESTAAHVDKAMKTELGYDAAVWQRVATELGWPALVIPEAQDGIGLGPLDLHPLLEEMGRHVFCSPFFGTVCLGTNALLVAGTAAQKQAHLPGIAAGEVTTATLGYRGPDVAAHREGADAVTLRAAEDRRGLHADRRRRATWWTATARACLVVAAWVDASEGAPAELGPVRAAGRDCTGLTRTALAHHGPDAAPREPALRRRDVLSRRRSPLSAMDGARALAVILDLAAVGLCRRAGGRGRGVLGHGGRVREGAPAVRAARLARSRASSTCARTCCSRWSARAAWRSMPAPWRRSCLSAGEITDAKARELSEAASSAKAYCSDAFFHCAGESIQIHGGIGFTWEHAAHLYFKRAQSSRTLLGSAQHHRERVASMLGQGGSMDLELTPEQEAFREEVRAWLAENLTGRFESLKGRGGPGDEHYAVDLRMDWNRVMGAAGWNCIGWPKSAGGRGVPLMEEVIFNEEYVRAGGPGRIGHIGETLLGPTLIHFGAARRRSRSTCRASWTAPRSGARATASPTRAATSPTSRPPPSWWTGSGSSTARRSGPASRPGRTTASCCAAPTRPRRSTRASATCWCP
jgi:alkylation response protein AidB-like acyl-CoA dehydrogenase